MRVLTFLGLEIDTEDMGIRMPQEKLEELKSDLIFKTKTNYAKKCTVPCWFVNFFGKGYEVFMLLTGVFMTLQ